MCATFHRHSVSIVASSTSVQPSHSLKSLYTSAYAQIMSPEQSNPVSGLWPPKTYGWPITAILLSRALSATWSGKGIWIGRLNTVHPETTIATQSSTSGATAAVVLRLTPSRLLNTSCINPSITQSLSQLLSKPNRGSRSGHARKRKGDRQDRHPSQLAYHLG